MQLDIEPPKPTEEFHKVYAEIYGRKKKEEKGVGKSIEIKENKELEMLDIPPLKLSSAESFTIPLLPEETEFARMDFLPQEKEAVEKKQGFLARLKMPLFRKKKEQEKNDIFMLAEPPLKSELPPLEKLEIETPRLELERLAKKEPLAKEKESVKEERKEMKREMMEAKEKQIPKVHDFLAEVKFGANNALKKEDVVKEYPVLNERRESNFEREMINKGARDLQTVFEKKHPNEAGGFEYLEKIEPLPLLSIGKEDKLSLGKKDKESIVMPKKEDRKSAEELKKYLKLVRDAEQDEKKKISEIRKKEKDIIAWTKKQQQQEKRIDEKTKKMQFMERGLIEKQNAVAQYEPKMHELYQREDAVLEKEREIKQRQADVHETETRLKAEEDTIIAKIKKLEADNKLLEKEQNAITKAVEKLNKEHLKINTKNNEFKDILKQIASAERELKEKAQIIDDREQRIKKKEKILELEVSRVQKLKRTAEHLKNVEETYKRMRERLRLAYKEYEEKFSSQKVYAPQEIRTVPLQPTFQPVRPMYETRAVESGDITNLITATKQLIIDKHYDEANKNINRLMQRYTQIPDTNPRKKEIYYEIVGLKNMLKLDLLE